MAGNEWPSLDSEEKKQPTVGAVSEVTAGIRRNRGDVGESTDGGSGAFDLTE
jgi:hypothetical protein